MSSAAESISGAGTVPRGYVPPFFDQLWDEMAETFRWPFEVWAIIFGNVAILIGAWFLLGPKTVTDYNNIIYLPVAMSIWAFADVPSTNVFGYKPVQTLANINNPRGLRRILTIRDVMMWLYICPACMAVALALMPAEQHPIISVATLFTISSLPFGFLGLATPIAALLPYHPIPMKERWHNPRSWPRWAAALIAPILLTIPAATITLYPALWLHPLLSGKEAHLTEAVLGSEDWSRLVTAVAIFLWSLLLWRLGVMATALIVAGHKKYLIRHLSDSSRG